jgi:hypothetical protein
MEDNNKIKIQIKSVFGDILFEYEKEKNTIKDTLEEAVRQGANLGDANLGDAYLRGANLRDAYLGGANLRDANLGGARNIPYIPLACPSDGAFVGWKKVRNKFCYIVKLEISEYAKRSSATTRKCRCDKAKVLDIINFDTKEHVEQVVNKAYDQETLYKVGEMVYPDKFDDNRWNECSNGIHFFINKQDAIDY